MRKTRVCGLLKAKHRKYFKKKRIVNYVKGCWEVESEEGWELTIRSGKVDVMIRFNRSNFSSVVGIKAYSEGVQRRPWEKAVLIASLDSSLEKFFKRRTGKHGRIWRAMKGQRRVPSRKENTACSNNDGYDATERENWLGKRERGKLQLWSPWEVGLNHSTEKRLSLHYMPNPNLGRHLGYNSVESSKDYSPITVAGKGE